MAKNKNSKSKSKGKGKSKSSSSSPSLTKSSPGAKSSPSAQKQARSAAQDRTVSEIDALAARAPTLASPTSGGPELPPPADIDLERSYRAALRAEQAWVKATEQLELERAAVADQLANIRERKTTLELEQTGLDGREQALRKQERELAELRSTLGQREEELRERETNARAGFERERLESRAEFDAIETQLRRDRVELERQNTAARRDADAQRRADQATHDQTLADERQALAEQLRARRAEFERDMQAQEAERNLHLEQRAAQLQVREAELQDAQHERQRLTRRQRFEAQRLDERAAELERHVELGVSDARQQFELERDALERRLQQLHTHSTALDERLQRHEAREHRAAGRSAEQLMEELAATRDERDQLTTELAARPSAAEAQELRSLAEELATLREERRRRLEEIARLEARLSDVAVAEQRLEAARTERDALEESGHAYIKAIEDMRGQLRELHSLVEAQTPFPQCSAMDSELASAPPAARDRPLELHTFIPALQAHMASCSQRHYRAEDLRAFLGGLAMSRLLLLQGFSGTGKTSLPIAFARAMGTEPIVIEVEAGWRDPQDLIGHYNTFEKRFYETELLQGLYLAQTPRWSQAVHIVVLDEMNLAHPEQYFSDFLSALERDPGEQRISLTTHRMGTAPERLEDGRKLRIPPNVWFVGTANHDETTKGFADKTYDRAHVMSLPDQPPRLELEASEEPLGVDYTQLEAAFAAAQREHEHEAERAVKLLAKLRPRLREVFGIGWGPRLDQQIRRYVPVVCAAGGELGEALDHILATRVLRKLSGRYDNRLDALQSLRTQLDQAWTELGHPANESIALLDAELRRLDPDAANEASE